MHIVFSNIRRIQVVKMRNIVWVFSFVSFAFAELALFTPVQIVRPNADHSGFTVVKETLSKIVTGAQNRKVAVVSVVGPYHSGKSFLLNALIGRTNVFSVGPKTSPETMGLWLCRTNVTLPSRPDVEVWFVDSEGFFGPQVSESYDAKTFTLSLLLADEFVYNTVKIIDSQAVALLEMLARRAQLFRVKSSVVETQSGLEHKLTSLPHLTWVVEDFVQTQEEGVSNTQWLESYLTADGVDQPYLKKLFPNLAVRSLFLPATSRQALADLSRVPFSDLTSEFRSDLAVLRKSIISGLEQREKYLTPSDLSQAIYFLATALDKGLFPQLPSLWTSWRSQVVESSMRDAIDLFDAVLKREIDDIGSGDAIVSAADFDAVSAHARNTSLTLLQELAKDFAPPEAMEGLLADLDEQLRKRHQESLAVFGESIKHFLGENLKKSFSTFLAEIPSVFDKKDLIEPSALQTALGSLAVAKIDHFKSLADRFVSGAAANLPAAYGRAAFPAYKTHPVDELRMQLQTQIDAIFVENDKAIATLMQTALATAVTAADDALASASSALLSSTEIDTLGKNTHAKAVAVFEKELGIAARPWMRSISPRFENSVKSIESEIKSKLVKFRRENEERLYEWFRKHSEKALTVYKDLKRSIEMSQLPCDEDRLSLEHDRAVTALVHALDVELGAAKFKDSNPYKETRQRLDGIIDSELAKLRKKNVELWKVHSDEATQCAFELNLQYSELNCPQGWFCWFKIWPGAHRARSQAHLLQCFSEASAKHIPPSPSIQQQIFESWYDKELGKEANEVKNNMWIAAVSLVVPIAWIVYIKRA